MEELKEEKRRRGRARTVPDCSTFYSVNACNLYWSWTAPEIILYLCIKDLLKWQRFDSCHVEMMSLRPQCLGLDQVLCSPVMWGEFTKISSLSVSSPSRAESSLHELKLGTHCSMASSHRQQFITIIVILMYFPHYSITWLCSQLSANIWCLMINHYVSPLTHDWRTRTC